MKMERPILNDFILKLIRKGWRVNEIADFFNITKERARRLISKSLKYNESGAKAPHPKKL